ncbi:MAG TPA: two-component regulator propeller domain-containing protein [Candidatus Polarisedimenticolia bacterium]|nr:two-component regulator propeller domain-containing protein [Candidatus Polarisedimenticolia bacterium]
MLVPPLRAAGAATILAIPLLTLPAGVAAAPRIERIGQEEGPMPDVVTALCLDRSGLLWIGSRDGLRLFDGETVREFDHDAADPASLSDNAIRVIHEDREGRLWVGTNSGGLNLLDRGRWRFDRYRHDPADPQSLSHDSVYAVLEDRAGHVWVGTQNGLNRLEPGSRRFTRFMAAPGDPNGLASGYILALQEDRAGRIWIGTFGGGLSALDPASGAITTWRSRPSDPATISDDRVGSLFEDQSGILWAGSVSGVNRVDPRDGSVRRVPWDRSGPDGVTTGAAPEAPLVKAFAPGRQGALWVGTHADGVLELDLATEVLRHATADDPAWPEAGSRQIEALLTDADGGLWIGTWGGGLRRVSPMAAALASARRRSAIPPALANANVTTVKPDGHGGAWFGTSGGPLALAAASVTPAGAGVTHVLVAHDQASSVYDVAEDFAGRIWYGTEKDLVRLDPGTGRCTRFAHDAGDDRSIGAGYVRVVTRDHLGRLWIGTGEGGVQRIDSEGRVVERHRSEPGKVDSLSDDYVTAIHEDRDGRLWVGTRSGGLDILDPSTGKAERYLPDPADHESLGHHYVTAIHADRRGRTWVATAGGGIALAEPGAAASADRPSTASRLRFRRFGERDGLVDDDVMAIVEDDDGSLWLPTRRGLARFDPEGPRFVTLQGSDGLPSAEFEPGCGARSGGLLYFCTVKGPIALAAGTPFPAVRPSPTIVASIRTPKGEVLADRPVWNLGRLSLPYGEWLAIDLAVLDYAPATRHRYAYRLEGGDWIDFGPSRQITFTQLKPATYRFSARGRNASGVWSAPTAEMTIEVVPPFWMTGWFRGVAILALVTAAVAVHRVRLAAVERRNRELEALTEQRERARNELAAAYDRLSHLTRRLEAAKEDERQRIARELHDDMGPSLTAVIINLQLLARGVATGLVARLHDTIGIVDRLVQRVRDLSLDLRPPLLDELGLGDALRGYMEAQAARAGLAIRVEAGDGLAELPREIQVHAFRVAQEAVTNAIRHAAARQVVVRLAREAGQVAITVRDDGRGFDARAVLGALSVKSVGLMGMQERVRSLGGVLVVDSAPGRGTEITARIPVGEAA